MINIVKTPLKASNAQHTLHTRRRHRICKRDIQLSYSIFTSLLAANVLEFLFSFFFLFIPIVQSTKIAIFLFDFFFMQACYFSFGYLCKFSCLSILVLWSNFYSRQCTTRLTFACSSSSIFYSLKKFMMYLNKIDNFEGIILMSSTH